MSDSALENLSARTAASSRPRTWPRNANLKAEAYDRADADRLGFWAEQAERLTWDTRGPGPRLVRRAVREVVRRAASSTRRTTASTGTSRRAAATRSPTTSRASPGRHPDDHLRRAARTRSARPRTR